MFVWDMPSLDVVISFWQELWISHITFGRDTHMFVLCYFCLVLILLAGPAAHSSKLLRETWIEFNNPSTMNDIKYSDRVYGFSEECIPICHSVRLNVTSYLQTVLLGNRVCNEMHEMPKAKVVHVMLLRQVCPAQFSKKMKVKISLY